MNGYKGILASKTFWASAVAIAAGAASIFGYTVTAADQAQLVELVGGIGAAVGGLGAIYGRFKASQKIG